MQIIKNRVGLFIFGTVVFLLWASCDGAGGLAGSRNDIWQTVKESVTYTVTFDVNGGDQTLPSQTVHYGSKIDDPGFVSKEKSIPGGWFRDRAATDPWDFTNDIVTKNITLYEKWDNLPPNTHVVRFIVTGAASRPADQINQMVTDGEKIIQPDNPERTVPEYIFDKWYKEGSSIPWDFVNDTVTDEINLIAGDWINIPGLFAVRFKANGGSPVPADQGIGANGKVSEPLLTIPPVTMLKSGYTFGGWYSDTACTAPWLFDTDTITGTTNLYAQWNKRDESGADVYSVNFIVNKGAPAPRQQLIIKYDPVAEPQQPTRTGYIFGGWFTDAACTPAKQWQLGDGGDPVSGNMILYAKWTPIAYTVIYNSNGGNGSMSPDSFYYDEEKTLTANSFTRTGYTFAGWTENSNGTGLSHPDKQSVYNWTDTARTYNLYAQWSCVITFDKNNTDTGSTDANPPTKIVTTPATTVVTLPTSPNRPNWTFNGWNTKADGTGTSFTGTTTVTGTAPVYAQWSCVITYNKNNTDPGSTDANPQTKTVTTPATTVVALPTVQPTRPGWTFNGWNTKADGSGIDFIGTTTVTGTAPVYAQWSCIITFDKNNSDTGSTDANPPTKTVTTPATTVVTLPTPPTRPGWAFNGWNTKADGSGTNFTGTTTVTGAAPVYAQWGVIHPTGVTLNKINLTLNIGDTETLIATVSPVDSLNKTVSWSANPSGIVSVDQTGKLTTLAGGTATVTVTTADGGKTANCAVTVATPVITITSQPAAVIGVTTGSISGSLSVTASVTPTGLALSYQWYSNTSNSNVGGTAVASGGTSANFTIPTTLTATTIYYCEVNANGAASVHTNPAIVLLTSTSSSSAAIVMVQVPAGSFTMGSPTSPAEPGRNTDETQHTVTLTGFRIGKYPVTQGQYKAVMGGANPSNFKTAVSPEVNTDNRPVETVSWYDAIIFCNRLSKAEGLSLAYTIDGETDPDEWINAYGSPPTSWIPASRWNYADIVAGSTGYRLPTEAQWEYACRAGTTHAFNWDTDVINSTQANYYASQVDANNLVAGTNLNRTTSVGSYAPNAWGLYDMHGNVWEWCWDWYSSSYYTAAGSGGPDPTGAVSGVYRVIRGGSWNAYGRNFRSACRVSNVPYVRSGDYGFRLVRP